VLAAAMAPVVAATIIVAPETRANSVVACLMCFMICLLNPSSCSVVPLSNHGR
jgi:hypothetical protein